MARKKRGHNVVIKTGSGTIIGYHLLRVGQRFPPKMVPDPTL